MMMLNRAYQAEFFDLIRQVETESIDLILSDMPYGTTACRWDSIIPFKFMWREYKRILKPNRAIVLTAVQPFSSALVMSNPAWFRYEWVAEKNRVSGFLSANKRPLPKHEMALVFSKGACPYYPELVAGTSYRTSSITPSEVYQGKNRFNTVYDGSRYPVSIQKYDWERGVHPTQKPVTWFEYLIRTYTLQGETVFDGCVGSGTTAVAAVQSGRNFIVGDNGIDERTGKPWALITTERLAALEV